MAVNMNQRTSKFVLELDGTPSVRINNAWEARNEAVKFATNGRQVRILEWTPTAPPAGKRVDVSIGQYEPNAKLQAEFEAMLVTVPGDYDENMHIALRNFESDIHGAVKAAGKGLSQDDKNKLLADCLNVLLDCGISARSIREALKNVQEPAPITQ